MVIVTFKSQKEFWEEHKGSILDNEKRFPLFNKVKKEHDISVYIEEQNKSLHAMGFTEHSFAHIGVVADRAGYILDTLGTDDHQSYWKS